MFEFKESYKLSDLMWDGKKKESCVYFYSVYVNFWFQPILA